MSPAEAARKLGVSVKALRLYEAHGLLSPARSEAGWRAYGPEHMKRASAIAGLRALSVGLKQIGALLESDRAGMADALGAHQSKLEREARRIGATIGEVRARRAALVEERSSRAGLAVRFALPWPWGGETFALEHLAPLTFITGPLGCGKTRLAKALAEHVRGAAYLGLDRLDVTQASSGHALDVMLTALDCRGDQVLIVDMVEEGMDEATQADLMNHVRAEMSEASAPLFFMTRSSTIADLGSMGPGELIIHCPANHSPPHLVLPFPGAPGQEAVASCLAPPDVRARTAGVMAVRAG
ncbi:MAG: MerR family transcriptional regulator [Pseudomonadota bacterium]